MRPFNLLLPSQNFILDGSCDKNKSLNVGNMERSLNLVQYCKLLFEILDQDFSYKKAQTISFLFFISSKHPILFSILFNMRLFAVASTALSLMGIAQAASQYSHPCQKTYKAVSGDSCQSVASKHGLSTDNLSEWTQMINS